MSEPCLCGDPYCGRCFPQGRENAPDDTWVNTCDICGASEGVTSSVGLWGHVRYLCPACQPSDEPGDSFYEGRG